MGSLRKTAATGLKWTLIERFSLQGISFVVSILLARMLQPEEFGLIGMITIFIVLGQTLVDAGLTSSLIRTKEPDECDYSTIFITTIVCSIMIYLIIFVLAPLISNFYKQPILTELVRALSLTILFRAISGIQYARLTKAMDFRRLMLNQVPAVIISAVVGIVMAQKGYGVWSLVFMQLVSAVISTGLLWFTTKWRPSLKFSRERFDYHFRFGINLTFTSVLNLLFDNIYNIVIGKFYSPAQLGFYTRAQTLQQLPVSNVAAAVDKVAFPLFSSIQDENKRLKSAYRQLLQQVIFWIAPILIGMAVLAEPLFSFLFTDKWLPAVPYFQMLSVVGILYPINAYNLNILKVKGRSDLIFKLEIIKKIIVVAGIITTVSFGIYGLLFFQIIFSLVALGLNSYYSGKFIDFRLVDQLKTIATPLFFAVLMGLLCYVIDVNFKVEGNLTRLLLGSFTGSFFYLSICLITKQEAALNFYTQFFKRKFVS